jgi:hypothetical protein
MRWSQYEVESALTASRHVTWVQYMPRLWTRCSVAGVGCAAGRWVLVGWRLRLLGLKGHITNVPAPDTG